MARRLFFRRIARGLAAGALAGAAAALPAISQGADPLDAARMAMQRLEFRAAIAAALEAREAAPEAPEPALALAEIHLQMARPALAFAVLSEALSAAPNDSRLLTARGAAWLAHNAYSRAIADFDTALAAVPNDPAARAGRARAYARAGLTTIARADYERALALAPDDPALRAEYQALVAAEATPPPDRVVYDAGALMAPEFTVMQGASTAPAHLVAVHAGNALDLSFDLLDSAALARAVEKNALRITHVFTYTGQTSAIWANLALICAGPDRFADMVARLRSAEGQAALDSIDKTGEMSAFEALTGGSLPEAGAEGDCARDRGRALAYLAEWNRQHDSLAWRGVNFYEHWPVFVLNEEVVSVAELNGWLAEALREAAPVGDPAADAPAPQGTSGTAAADIVADAAPPTPEIAPQSAPPAHPQTEPPGGSAGGDAAAAETPPAPADPAPQPMEDAAPASDGPTPDTPGPGTPADTPAPEPAADAPPTEPDPESDADGTTGTPPPPDQGESDPAPPAQQAARTADLPSPAEGARLPAVLKGVWAPSLAACIGYTDRITEPQALDVALPALNDLSSGPLGTVLLTGKRLHLFNAVGALCALQAYSEGEDGGEGWEAALSCGNPIAKSVTTTMRLTHLADDGPAPRMLATYGDDPAVEMVQCRPLGGLGSDFAPLWALDGPGCRAVAPLVDARVEFRPGAADTLEMVLAPMSGAGADAAAAMRTMIDMVPLASGAPAPEDGQWTLSLGPFDTAATRLARGLLFDIAVTAGQDAARWRLPLLGSGKAVAHLEACRTSSP